MSHFKQNILKIPGIGGMIRIFSALIHSPKWFDILIARSEKSEEFLQSIEKRTQSVEKRMQSVEDRLNNGWEMNKGFSDSVVNAIGRNEQAMNTLNRELSIHKTIWGNPSKLHIHPSAAVSPCLFNVNSGDITIGAYTFAGSRVSILAGSHDKNLKGFLRRDAELTEGCDIIVGDGVWLGSNCTLLGPCQVGDNAVIAAGAVVIPGTKVPAGTIYGGIPAKQIGVLDSNEKELQRQGSVIKALERNKGFLCVEGWSEKKMFPGINQAGHYLEGIQGTVLADKEQWLMQYGLEGNDESDLLITGDGETLRMHLKNRVGSISVHLPVAEKCITELVFICPTENVKLFISMTASETRKPKKQKA